jgi:hypothetical protein
MVLNHERSLQIARVASLVASTAISLACGTNVFFNPSGPWDKAALMLLFGFIVCVFGICTTACGAITFIGDGKQFDCTYYCRVDGVLETDCASQGLFGNLGSNSWMQSVGVFFVNFE